MLVQFSVKNWRSIKDEQTLSFVMAKGDELIDANTFDTNAPGTDGLLRSLAIYGPNAAGKSNLVMAIRAMRQTVLNSASKWKPGDTIPVEPFLLDHDTEKEPSEFEAIFIVEGVRYQYGFSATTERIIEEWLYAYPLGRAQRWFSRYWNSSTNTYTWELGGFLSGKKQLWTDSTRENGLFLSTAVQLNSQQLKPIYDWFRKTLHVAGTYGWDPDFTVSLCGKPTEKKKILAFLQAADLDIDDLVVESKKFTSELLPEDMPQNLKQSLLEEMKDKEIFEIKTIHLSAQGQRISFDIEDESDGTQKLFRLAGPWLDALQDGCVLFIDELNNSLHPKMVEFLVKLFHNNQTNPKNAQLVFSTHETSVLNQELFRRDQIWFCEKNKSQATQCYPLTDFSPRKGRENLEAGYLSGRYGALPYLREIIFDNEVKSGE